MLALDRKRLLGLLARETACDADFVVFVLFGEDFGSAGATVDCFGSAPLPAFPDRVSRRPGEWVLIVQFKLELID